MPFIKETIKEDEVKRFNIEAIDDEFNVDGPNSRKWIVDRDRNMYLRCVSVSHHEQSKRYTWTFYWYGELLLIDLDLLHDIDSFGQANWKLDGMVEYGADELSQEHKEQKEEILEDLNTALNECDLDVDKIAADLTVETEVPGIQYINRDLSNEQLDDDSCEILWVDSLSRLQALRDNHL